MTPDERTRWVAVGAGAVPEMFTASIDDPTLPVVVQIHVRSVGGRPAIDEMAFLRRGLPVSGIVTTELLRRIRPPALLRHAMDEAKQARTDRDDGTFQVEGQDPGIAWGGPRFGPGRGRAMDDETLGQVAQVYRQALAEGLPPTRTVADRMNCSRTTAGRWVMQARERGHLGKAIRRQAGEKQEKRR